MGFRFRCLFVEGSSPEELGLVPCPLVCLGIAIPDRSLLPLMVILCLGG